MTRSGFLFAVLALAGCKEQPEGPRSLVGDFAAPGLHVVAQDTIVVWRRIDQPNGSARLTSFTVGTAGAVQVAEEAERGEVYADADSDGPPLPGEKRGAFQLSPADFAALHAQAALLRPQGLAPEIATGGYAGEALPTGCARAPEPPALGVNYLNNAGWGAFVLQPSCTGAGADAARGAMGAMLAILDRASGMR